MVETDLIERIKSLRVENNLSQSEVAKSLDIRTKQYIEYEEGIKRIPTRICVILVKMYNVNCDYLLGLTAKREPYPPSEEDS